MAFLLDRFIWMFDKAIDICYYGTMSRESKERGELYPIDTLPDLHEKWVAYHVDALTPREQIIAGRKEVARMYYLLQEALPEDLRLREAEYVNQFGPDVYQRAFGLMPRILETVANTRSFLIHYGGNLG